MNNRILWFVFGVSLVLIAVLPPLSPVWQAHLTTHILVQYAFLVGAGTIWGAALAGVRRAYWSAPAALLAAALALAFWLMPRWIDAALAAPMVDLVKAVCLVGLVGMPLGWGWTQAGPVLRGFAWANAVSMLAVMGWLELAVPARLCNSYLLSDQRQLGLAFVSLALALLVAGLGQVLLGRHLARLSAGLPDTPGANRISG